MSLLFRTPAFCFACVFVAGFLFVPGCPGKKNGGHRSSTTSEERQSQSEDAFRRAIEFFDSLEETPVLRGLPGASQELQIVSRLDKWAANRIGNKLWKDDPLYRELKNDSGTLIGNMSRLNEDIATLQSDDETRISAIDSDIFLQRLRGIPDDLRTLSQKCGIDFSDEIARLSHLADRFQRVRNIRETAALAQVDQVKSELAQIAVFRDHLAEIEYLFDVEALDFQSADADHFKQTVWTRNISHWARGEKLDELSRAAALFDWTISNIDLRQEQIQLPSGEIFVAPPQQPWQTLVLGHGTAMDRAWVFIELLRQQRIDATLLGIEDAQNPENTRIWAVGVFCDNEIHLFVPDYGLAIPGPAGLELGPPQLLSADSDTTSGETSPTAAHGEIACRDIATLSQVLADDRLLRQLDTEERPFPVTAGQCRRTVALIVCAPSTASQRMSLVQNELSGEESMVLYQSYRDIAGRLSQAAGIETIRHWLRPIQAMYEREVSPQRIDVMMSPFHMRNPKSKAFALWAGRVLYFKGALQGEESAITFFRDASVSDREIGELRKLSHDNAERLMRSTPEAIADEVRTMEEQGRSLDVEYYMTEEMHLVYLLAKRYARYWIALACAENGKLSTAIEHFEREETEPLNVTERLLAYPIAYNLGRALEKAGRYEEAMDRYGKYPQAPGAAGNAVRVKWLNALLTPKPERSEEPERSEHHDLPDSPSPVAETEVE